MMNTVIRRATRQKNYFFVSLLVIVLSLGSTVSLEAGFKEDRIKAKETELTSLAVQQIQQQEDEVCPPFNSNHKQKGRWCTIKSFTKPVMAVHMSVLRDGRVIAWGNKGRPKDNEPETYEGSKTAVQIWNPNIRFCDRNPLALDCSFCDANPNSPECPPPGESNPKRVDYLHANLFCSGHSFLPDGKLLITGGIDNGAFAKGISSAVLFDYTQQSPWIQLPNMNNRRWYPTNLALGNGNTLVFAGTVDVNKINTIPQLLENQQNVNFSWRELNITNPTKYDIYYSWLHLLSDGRVLVNVNSQQRTGLITFRKTRFLKDLWSEGSLPTDPPYAGACVLYDKDKILTVGGGDEPKYTAETIDMNAVSPQWSRVRKLITGRRHLNATLLADGKVLVTGGNKGIGFNNNCLEHHVKTAEMWDPAGPQATDPTKDWTELASATQPRLYHSTAVLLPDGRVLTGGTTIEPEQVCPPTLPPADYETCKITCPQIVDNYNMEVFYPPYLFNNDGTLATRPVIEEVPTQVSYGQNLQFRVTGASAGAQVNLIRLPSVTHSFNQNQGVVKRTATAAGTNLQITIPANRNECPPGHYMMFVLDSNGVPSKAKIIQIS